MADTASSLSDSTRALGFEAGRFKTGTPCRLNGNSINLGRSRSSGAMSRRHAFHSWKRSPVPNTNRSR